VHSNPVAETIDDCGADSILPPFPFGVGVTAVVAAMVECIETRSQVDKRSGAQEFSFP
jgi:hypothetical protein